MSEPLRSRWLFLCASPRERVARGPARTPTMPCGRRAQLGQNNNGDKALQKDSGSHTPEEQHLTGVNSSSANI